MKYFSSFRNCVISRGGLFSLLMVLVVSSLALAAAETLDEAEIRQIVGEQVTSWNAGDGVRYAAHFAEEGSFTNLFGMVMYGKKAFAKRHGEILASFYKHTSKEMNVTRIRFVTSDVAIVDIDNKISGVTALPPGIPVPTDGILRTQLMQVFVKRRGAWWVEAYHNVDLKPALKPSTR